MTSQPSDQALPSPPRLVRLLQESGWEQVSRRGDLYLRFLPPGDELGPHRQSLLVPLKTDAPDFQELMRDAVRVLRQLPSNSAAFTLLSRLTADPTDQFTFAKETTAPKGWIRWGEGESLITSARGLLLAGAKTAREPLNYYGNRHGRFANRFLDEVMMGQTEVGSYVVRAYVPVDRAIPLHGGKKAEEGAHYPGHDALASRDVSQAVVSTLSSATEAIDHYRAHDSLSAFKSPKLALSYESVVAIKGLAENADYTNITVTWEQSETRAPHDLGQEFTFTRAEVPVLELAANELVKPERRSEVSVRGSVHLLSRSEAEGPGVVGIATLDGQPAKKVRVRLEGDDYHRALAAHDHGQIIQVTGDLEKEGNLSWLYQARIVAVTEQGVVDQAPSGDPEGMF